jgi:hypothetical protein
MVADDGAVKDGDRGCGLPLRLTTGPEEWPRRQRMPTPRSFVVLVSV